MKKKNKDTQLLRKYKKYKMMDKKMRVFLNFFVVVF